MPAQIFPGRVKAAAPAEKQPRVFLRELPHRSSLQLGAATEIFQGEKPEGENQVQAPRRCSGMEAAREGLRITGAGYDRLMCFPGNQDKPKLIIKGMSLSRL